MSDFLDWLDDCKIPVIITFAVLVVIITAIVWVIPAPFKEAIILEKSHEDFKTWVAQEKDMIYRTQHYTDIESYRDSNGNTVLRSVSKTRQVYDHTDLVTYRYDDDEDFIFLAESTNKKSGYCTWERIFNKDKEPKQKKFYVEKETYEKYGIERKVMIKDTKCWGHDKINKTEIERHRI